VAESHEKGVNNKKDFSVTEIAEAQGIRKS
jgi:hypothetical protein